MVEHKTRRVKWGHREAEIDEGIADLILEIWKAGIGTCNSCEDNVPKGYVWIEFIDASSAERFLDIVVNRYSDSWSSLYQRVYDPWSDFGDIRPKGWHFRVLPFDFSTEDRFVDEDTIETVSLGPPSMSFTLSVRFPRTDLATVLRRMVKYNKEQNEREGCPHCLTAVS